MMNTVRLFDKDAYAVSFSSKVISCEKKGELFETILEETLFFPEQGGQSPDKGMLGGAMVTDVQNHKGVIVHLTKEKPEVTEGKVSGQIDWEHRFSNMQQHSGEHVFSGLINKKFGYDNVGFHLSDNVVTLDTSGPLTKEQIEELEKEANRVIMENHPVKIYYPSEQELETINFRCKSGIEGEVRIVDIEGVDTCACCAPHVMSTCQIGVLRVVDYQNYKGGTRISILCGTRALEYCRKEGEILGKISVNLSCKKEDIPEFIDKIKDEKNEIIEKLKFLQSRELEKVLEEIEKDVVSPLVFTEVEDTNLMRKAVNSLTEKHKGYCGIFSGTEGNYRFIIGSSTSDCQILSSKLKEMGVKGGGSKQMIQGTANLSRTELEKILKNM